MIEILPTGYCVLFSFSSIICYIWITLCLLSAFLHGTLFDLATMWDWVTQSVEWVVRFHPATESGPAFKLGTSNFMFSTFKLFFTIFRNFVSQMRSKAHGANSYFFTCLLVTDQYIKITLTLLLLKIEFESSECKFFFLFSWPRNIVQNKIKQETDSYFIVTWDWWHQFTKDLHRVFIVFVKSCGLLCYWTE